jgi:cell division protein FtsB
MSAPTKAAPRTPSPKSAVRTPTKTPARPPALAERARQAAENAPRPVRWLVAPTPHRAPRTPFILLILGLLGFGLVGLLLLNTATASGSFREQALQQQNSDLTLKQQELQRAVGALDTPQALASAAAKLGMVPGGDPAFLVHQPDGQWKVMGNPTPATAPPVQPAPKPKPKPKPKAKKTTHHAAKKTAKKTKKKATPTTHEPQRTTDHSVQRGH